MNEVWNLDPIYKGFEDPAFEADLNILKEKVAAYAAFTAGLKVQDDSFALCLFRESDRTAEPAVFPLVAPGISLFNRDERKLHGFFRPQFLFRARSLKGDIPKREIEVIGECPHPVTQPVFVFIR